MDRGCTPPRYSEPCSMASRATRPRATNSRHAPPRPGSDRRCANATSRSAMRDARRSRADPDPTPRGDTMPWMEDERAALVATARDTDPDAPTLCEGWTARHLLAHLVEREHQPWFVAVD